MAGCRPISSKVISFFRKNGRARHSAVRTTRTQKVQRQPTKLLENSERSRFRHESFVPVRRSAHVYLGGARGQWGFVVVVVQVRDARFVIAIAAMHKARILRSDTENVQH